MKILHISSFEEKGGAALAASRLNTLLISREIDSSMVTISDKNDFKRVASFYNQSSIVPKIRNLIDKVPHKIIYGHKKGNFSSNLIPNKKIVAEIKRIKPDIIHLHWINAAFFKISDLKGINIPIVWSLHDMWPITGGCHYSMGCLRFQNECGNCILLKRPSKNDLSKINFLQKREAISNIKNLTFNIPSSWLQKYAMESSISKKHSFVSIPNPIPRSKFFCLNSKKTNLSLPCINFFLASANPQSDPRKGLDKYSKLASSFSSIERFKFYVISDHDLEISDLISIKPVFGSHRLNKLYNKMHVAILLSKEENYSNSIIENFAVGNPAIAFNIGGNSDIIDHKINGFLVNPESPEDLIHAINWISENYVTASKEAIKKYETKYSDDIIFHSYHSMYTKLLGS